MTSCHVQRPFNSFYNQQKKDVKFAFTIPKYIAKPFIPKESKELVNRLTKGVKKVRVLTDFENGDELSKGFQKFTKSYDYVPYFYMDQDGSNIQLLTYEKEDLIHEIVFAANSDEGGVVIIAIQGKIPKENLLAIAKLAL